MNRTAVLLIAFVWVSFGAYAQFTLTLQATGSGTTVPEPGPHDYPAGSQASITAVPDAGHELLGWFVDGTEVPLANPLVVTMDADKEVWAVFSSYILTLEVSGSGQLSPPAGQYAVVADAVETLTAFADPGWRFDHWVVNGADAGTDNPLTMTMDEDKTVTALFVQQFALTLSVIGDGALAPPSGLYTHDAGTDVPITATPDSGHELLGWVVDGDVEDPVSPLTVTMDADHDVSALFTSHIVTVAADGNGSVAPTPGEYAVADDYDGQFSAAPAPDWRFDHWEVDGVDQGADMPLSLTITADTTVTAVFVRVYTLTLTAEGEGDVDPPEGTLAFDAGVDVVITATPAAAHELLGWIVDGDLEAPTIPLTVTMDADHEVVALFTSHIVTVAVEGNGSVAPPPGDYPVADGYDGQFSAAPAPDWRFDHWEVDGVDQGADMPLSLTITADTTVTAVFVRVYTLTLTVQGEGDVDPPEGTHEFDAGEDVVITATPAAGHALFSWVVDGAPIDPDNPLTVTMDADKTVYAVFSSYILTFAVTGSGQISPPVGPYPALDGAEVLVTAAADPSWRFDHWEVDGADAGSDIPLSVTADHDAAIRAVFVETRTLVLASFGEGAVNPTPGTYSYAPDTVVQIAATANAAHALLWWYLDGEFIEPANPLSVTMDTDHEVAAMFSSYIVSLTVDGGGATEPAQGDYPVLGGTPFAAAAVPSEGWEFDHWEVDGLAAGSDSPQTWTIDADRTITAVFREVRILALSIEGEGATDPAPGSYVYDRGEDVAITATPNDGHELFGWLVDDELTDAVNPLTVSLDTDRTVLAVFSSYIVTIEIEGTGTVEPSPGTYPVVLAGEFAATASGEPGWVFDHWEVDGVAAGPENPKTWTIDADTTITAVFIEAFTLTLSQTGRGATDPAPGLYVYDPGTDVVVTATPEEGHEHVGWVLDGTVVEPTSPLSLTMDVDHTLDALFTAFVVTVAVQGNGTVNPPAGEYTLQDGGIFSAVATAGTNALFDHWEVNGADAGSTVLLELTVEDDLSVVAVFLTTYTVRVTVAPAQAGTVAAEPLLERYAEGTDVTLTATPNPGYQFVHWQGVADQFANPITLSVDDDLNVTALFEKEPCLLGEAAVLSPWDAATLSVPTGAQNVPLLLVAATDCIEDTAEATLTLDGLWQGVASAAGPSGYYAMSYPSVADVGLGPHTLAVAASAVSEPMTVVQGAATFALATADDDGNLNGIPDGLFDVLDTDGALWGSVLVMADTGRTVLTGALRWNGAETKAQEALPVVLAIQDPAAPSHVVTVSVPAALLEPGETGVLIVQTAPDLASLYGVIEAAAFAAEPAALVAGGRYVEVSLIVSADQGATFTEVEAARLATDPVRLSIEGLELSALPNPALYAHPTFVDSDPVTGIEIVAEPGLWAPAEVADLVLGDTWLSADLRALSALAVYDDTVDAPAIAVNPSPVYRWVYGAVEVGQCKDQTFTVENAGGGVLVGAAAVSGAFSLVSDAAYSLGPGESQDITVRFAPTAEQEFTATITFAGGGGATVDAVGSGYEPEPEPPMSCPAGTISNPLAPDTLRRSSGTIALLLGTMAALLLAGRLWDRDGRTRA